MTRSQSGARIGLSAVGSIGSWRSTFCMIVVGELANGWLPVSRVVKDDADRE